MEANELLAYEPFHRPMPSPAMNVRCSIAMILTRGVGLDG